jgi:Bacterial PH domain
MARASGKSRVMDHEVFPIARGSSAARWLCGVIGVLTFALGAFIGTFFFLGSRIVTLEVSDRGVRVHGDIYGRLIKAADLKVAQARILDIGVESGYKPAGRTNGLGLPNYQSGWFRLANGSKALLFVTDWNRAVVVPTTEGFDLVVSPADPQSFRNALNHPNASAATFALSTAASSRFSVISGLLIPVALLIPLAIAALMGYLAYSTRAVTFEVTHEGLRVRGDLFGRLIPRGSLLVENAEILNLKAEPNRQPFLRTMGVGLPGYSSGWFRLRDRAKGLLFLTDPSRAVYLPTTDGYTLLISPADPEGLLAALKA